jgi:hypothetical protein
MASGMHALDAGNALSISIDTDYKSIKTGDTFDIHTTVTNNGEEVSSQMFVAMNIMNLQKNGDPVDPEDWSSRRTQAIAPLAEGQSAAQSWTVHAILEGDYMLYMVLIPEPNSSQGTSPLVASTGIHMIVAPFTNLNPAGVLPLAIGMPLGLTLLMLVLVRTRNRNLNTGHSSSTVENFQLTRR